MSTAHKGACISHRHYHMTCEEFCVLVDAYADSCGICKTPGPQTAAGHLCVDHDHEMGEWAVRGLLCGGCNFRLRLGVGQWPRQFAHLADAARAYVENPWYVRRFAERGISIEPLRQPAIGIIIGSRAGHYWCRTKEGWVAMHKKRYNRTVSWDWLNQQLGPHNIWIPPRTHPRYQVLHEMRNGSSR